MSKRLQKLGVAMVMMALARAMTTAQQSNPDNTAVNKRDKAPAAITADQQSNQSADLNTTREIRRAIVADKSLSTYAHNIKVITVNGKVTLKGPVRSDAERTALEAKAVAVAGASNVVNDLSIAKPRTKKSS